MDVMKLRAVEWRGSDDECDVCGKQAEFKLVAANNPAWVEGYRCADHVAADQKPFPETK